MKWITREKVQVERVACPGAIRKFRVPNAEFIVHDALYAKRRRRVGSAPTDDWRYESDFQGCEKHNMEAQ